MNGLFYTEKLDWKNGLRTRWVTGFSQVWICSGRVRSELQWALALELAGRHEADSQVQDHSRLALEVGDSDPKYPCSPFGS